MAHVNRRIGKSSETANVTADGTGGGVLDTFLGDYFNRSGNVYNAPGAAAPKGHTATGGVISDYIEPGPGNIYRAHIFTESGTFDVTVLGESYGNTVEYLVVAGGGGGGANVGGGGGAGGMRTGSTTVSASPGTHPVVIGGGGFSVLGN